MKNKHILFISSAILALFFFSCSDMNDNVDKWLDGEIVYGAKVDSVKTYSGKNRIKMDLYVSSQRINKINIYWNDKKDSTVIMVNNQKGIYTTILENLQEKDYLFHIYTYDKYNNVSLRTDVNGVAYGSTYEEDLLSRGINKYYSYFDLSTHTYHIYWGGKVEGSAGLKLSYIDVNGEKQELDVPMDAEYTKVENVAKELSILTLYQPKNMIDNFSASSTIPLYYEQEIDKKDWKIINVSSQWIGYGMPASNLIDGQINTAWHTNIGPDQRTKHWFIIDMGKEYNVTGLGIFGPQDPKVYGDQVFNNNYSLKFAPENVLANEKDPYDDNWSKLGEYKLIQGETREMFVHRTNSFKARYLMFHMDYGNQRDGICTLAEINAYTATEDNYIK